MYRLILLTMSWAAAEAETPYFSLVQLRASPAALPVLYPQPEINLTGDSVFHVMCDYNITWSAYQGTFFDTLSYWGHSNVKWDDFDTCLDPDEANQEMRYQKGFVNPKVFNAAVDCAKEGMKVRVLRQTFPTDFIIGAGSCCNSGSKVEDFTEHCKIVHGKARQAMPIAECAPGSCTIWGDPHILTFDLHSKHLLQHPHREALFRTRKWKDDQVSVQEEGTFWLVKSKDIQIQGRYWRNKTHPELSSLGALAIGGAFIENNVLVVRPTSGKVTWNDLEILSSIPSQFTNDLVIARYHTDSVMVKDGRKGPAIELYLPKGVKLTINRWAQMLAAQIDMCKEEDQDGQCGNFNGVHQDDSTEDVMSRMGEKIMPEQFLFERYRATSSVALPAAEAKRYKVMNELQLDAEDLMMVPDTPAEA